MHVAHLAADWDASRYTPAVLLPPPPDAHSSNVSGTATAGYRLED